MNTYHYDPTTKEYTHSETASLDPLETKRQGHDIYLLPANATFIRPIPADGYANVWNGIAWEHIENNRGTNYWLATDEYGTPARTMKELGALPEGATRTAPPKPFSLAKEEALIRAQETFAARRDRIRYVDGYGYDCAAEDITNSMAAYTPLLVAGAGTTQYKVHLPDGKKGIVTLSENTMTRVYSAVRTSQFEDYAWYETVRAQLNAAQTKDELAAILDEAGIRENDSDITDSLGEPPAEAQP